jgi:hypothetical protein
VAADLEPAKVAGSSTSTTFNLADVGYVGQLNDLPSGVKGLVYLGMANGADAAFETAKASAHPPLSRAFADVQDVGDPQREAF